MINVVAGFTGSRYGMTDIQKQKIASLLSDSGVTEFHHGDCVGSDADAHDIAVALGIKIVVHPPKNSRMRAFKSTGETLTLGAKAYMPRNKDIVDASTIIFSTPAGNEKIRSGTWATIRLAKKSVPKKEAIVMVYPDGSMENINQE